jgi:hypothetical protein
LEELDLFHCKSITNKSIQILASKNLHSLFSLGNNIISSDKLKKLNFKRLDIRL